MAKIRLRSREPTFRDAIDVAVEGDKKHLVAMIREGHPRTDADRELLADYISGGRKRGVGNPGNSDPLTPFGFDPKKVRTTDLQIAAVYVMLEMDEARERGERVYGLRKKLIEEAIDIYSPEKPRRELTSASIEKEIERQRKKYPRPNK